MFERLFKNVTDGEKNNAIEGIIGHATPRYDFFIMLILSVSMASFGILLNSTIILVGSMLIAPLLFPLLSLSLGIVVSDGNLIGRSFYTIIKSIGFAVASGFIIGLLFSSHNVAFTFPFVSLPGMPSPLIYALVAAIAGLAAAFAVVKPRLNDTLPGVAISVSLVPPLAVAGIAISSLNWTVFSNALLLFIVNVAGIVFTAMIVLSLFKFSVKRTITQKLVKKEEKVVEKEEKIKI
jgi:uncharacterized hydrophobic protein (TIGR00271 family)